MHEHNVGEFRPAKKKRLKKHLSPSRQRALCPFFVQMRMWCKRSCNPGGPWGSVGDRQFHSLQIFDEKCSAVALGRFRPSPMGRVKSPVFAGREGVKYGFAGIFRFSINLF
ncbi:hypothetical protein [Pseudomonas mohnii]